MRGGFESARVALAAAATGGRCNVAVATDDEYSKAKELGDGDAWAASRLRLSTVDGKAAGRVRRGGTMAAATLDWRSGEQIMHPTKQKKRRNLSAALWREMCVHVRVQAGGGRGQCPRALRIAVLGARVGDEESPRLDFKRDFAARPPRELFERLLDGRADGLRLSRLFAALAVDLVPVTQVEHAHRR
eukprot:3283094-Pleurochrysis_carterae.AAC.6